MAVEAPTVTHSAHQSDRQPNPQSAASAPSLMVEVEATVKARQEIDLVDLFLNLDERAQARYQAIYLADLGFTCEWERPLAFLWPDDDDVVPYSLSSGAQGPVWGDVDSEIRVRGRNGNSIYGYDETQWNESDFNTLISAVGWMRNFHKAQETGSSEDVARLPGPADVSLF